MFQRTCYLLGKGTAAIHRCLNGNTVQVAETLPYGYFLHSKSKQEYEAFPAGFIRDGWCLPEENILGLLGRRHETCTFVESCTGGMCAEKLTSLPGSSEIFWGGWVVYSNAAKIRLGVASDTLRRHGAVSRETVIELAGRGREHSGASWCVAVSGIAGPSGGSAEKPAGTVWIGLDGGRRPAKGFCFRFPGNREAVRQKASAAAFLLLELLVLHE